MSAVGLGATAKCTISIHQSIHKEQNSQSFHTQAINRVNNLKRVMYLYNVNLARANNKDVIKPQLCYTFSRTCCIDYSTTTKIHRTIFNLP